MTDVWSPGTQYPPGSVVVPRARQPLFNTKPGNADFEDGDTGWTKGAGWTITTDKPFEGEYSAEFNGTTESYLVNDTEAVVEPGLTITAKCQIQQGASDADHASGWVAIQWFDGDGTLISTSTGNVVSSSSSGWMESSVTATAPANAAKAKFAIGATKDQDNPLYADLATWNYSYRGVPAGLVYQATQEDVGISGVSEPEWPTEEGATVTDGSVTWTAHIGSTVIWRATPMLLSGQETPNWPLEVGATVYDGSIVWETITPAVVHWDENCPNTKVVAIAVSKVFCGDDDIVRFSATSNPLDWSSESNAGFLPTGMWTVGETICTALGLYRGNLVVFTASGMQVWQVDPDPLAMSNMDTVDGIGTSYPYAHASIAQDLYFTSHMGVRSVSVAAGSENMEAIDVGTAIDELVRDRVRQGVYAFAVYLPSLGQYWLILGDEAFVYSKSVASGVAAWSYYTFPWTIDYATVLDGKLYVRADNTCYVLDETYFVDDLANGSTSSIDVTIGWSHLEPSRGAQHDSQLTGVDLVASNEATVSIGFDEIDGSRETVGQTIGGNTRFGGIVPVHCVAPSFAPKITHSANEAFELTRINLYVVQLTKP